MQRAIELTEIRTERDDGADSEHAFDDIPSAETVDERGADRSDETEDDKERRADNRASNADVAHTRGALTKTILLFARAPKKFDEQRAADVESLVHVRVHLRVGLHGLTRNVAQCVAEPLRGDDEQWKDHNADESQLPLHREHNNEQRNRFDQVGDDIDDGIADCVLRADHVVVESAHQLARFCVGEKAQ